MMKKITRTKGTRMMRTRTTEKMMTMRITDRAGKNARNGPILVVPSK